MGCCWNISLPWTSPVAASAAPDRIITAHAPMAAGRYIVRASSSVPTLWERTIHQPQIPATKVLAVSRDPATVWGNAASAVLLVRSSVMLTSSARPVSGL